MAAGTRRDAKRHFWFSKDEDEDEKHKKKRRKRR